MYGLAALGLMASAGRCANPPAADPEFPVGWYAPGTCTDAGDLRGVRRDSARAHLDVMRAHGVNVVLESASADGRIVARGVDQGWYNWYGFSYVRVDGERVQVGNPRPGVFVEGMRWLLDEAYYGAPDDSSRMYAIVSLASFATPGYEGEPYGGSDVLTCGEYRDFIDREINRNARYDTKLSHRIPRVECAESTGRPFWEWNIRYIVQSLANHPGLSGWYLWDEPEGITYRHLFGIHEEKPPPPFEGPGSLPTTDLLRYVYELVRKSDENAGSGVRHPVIVDIHSPHVFFSDRFEWSEGIRRDPIWSSGPFDVTPSGTYATPADILGLEASSYLAHTSAKEDVPRMEWYWDQRDVSRNAAMLAEVVARDDLEGAMVIAGQAQLPGDGPYAAAHELRCSPSGQRQTRLLNDRDLVWHFLTPIINGLRGYVYYSHALMPARGPGGRQVERSNRLIQQFRTAGLDDVLLSPGTADKWNVVEIRIEALTNYYRSDPSFIGSAKTYASRLSAFSQKMTVSPSDYSIDHFGRSDDPEFYGQATNDPVHELFPNHRLLRTSVHAFGGYDFLLLSNAFDARIIARIDRASADRVEEGSFDLDPRGLFKWSEPTDAAISSERLLIPLEPYEARVFRVRNVGN